jgi:hypothetical protein
MTNIFLKIAGNESSRMFEVLTAARMKMAEFLDIAP